MHRLHLLKKRLDRDKIYAEKYYNEMNRLLEQGFAEKIDSPCLNGKLWYVPHFGVQKQNNKVRLVFDAAARTGSTCLNNLLLRGLDNLKSLVGVLMRFRQFLFAVIADIKDMFMRITLRQEDRDAQRFLWRGRDRTNEPSEYRMRVLLFGAKSSPSTAIYIKNKNAMQFASRYPIAVRKIIENCYMDDIIDSCESEEELLEVVKHCKIINTHAGFELHRWASNSSTVLKQL